MDQRVYLRNLKLDLIAAQRGRGGQRRDLCERARELIRRLGYAERSSDRCPALPHRPAAFSISPASVQ